jgi:hypothetical protein
MSKIRKKEAALLHECIIVFVQIPVTYNVTNFDVWKTVHQNSLQQHSVILLPNDVSHTLNCVFLFYYK